MLIFVMKKKNKKQGKERKGSCPMLGLSEAKKARTSIKARPSFNYIFFYRGR